MIKAEYLKACLLIVTVFFCSQTTALSVGPCSPPDDCPQNLPTIPETVQFPQGWHFQWASNNPQTIADGSSVDIFVIGGNGPYSWTVSGHAGFSLDQSVTTEVTNLLFNNGACGTAKITVTDERGIVVAGQVRSTKNSSWQQVGGKPTCRLPGVPDVPYEKIPGSGYTATRTVGGQRQTERIVAVSGGRTCDASCDPAECDCSNAAYTANGGGCEPCLSLPPSYANYSYNCRYSIYHYPLLEGTFYCFDYTVYECRSDVFGFCGGSVPANAFRCYASIEQYYEEWQCNP